MTTYIFIQKQFTKTEQLKILDTLLKRLEETSQMNPQSFEYQQAMYQISGQEFDHTLERINGIFKSCYFRSGWWSWFIFWQWILIALLVIPDSILIIIAITNY